MSELSEQQRFVRILELMEVDYAADPAKELWRPFSAEAAKLDYVLYIKTQTAMRAGEMPSPAGLREMWDHFLQTQRVNALNTLDFDSDAVGEQ